MPNCHKCNKQLSSLFQFYTYKVNGSTNNENENNRYLCEKCNKKTKCENCCTPVTSGFYTCIPNSYRCHSISVFFCSEQCDTTYQTEKMCNKCHYNKNLVYVPEEKYMLCNDYLGNSEIPCYEQYLRRKNPMIECLFCEEDCRFLHSFFLNDCEYYYCTDCYDEHKEMCNVLITKPQNQCPECVFCKKVLDENHVSRVWCLTLCVECASVYKQVEILTDYNKRVH